ncbi:alpha/beta hydrolase [Actinoplanes sp. NPDC049599]|uniref:alpha/beta hydrolase n=1 Tax=Actinoplanes sp. NPDC049599 TaxID=3363903 RepID=UPI0037A09CC6
MAGFDEINLYAEPGRMLGGARQLAGVAAKLGPAGIRHRAVELAPAAFGAAPHSAAAHRSWRQAATLIASYLTAATPAIEAMSEGVYRSSEAYRSGDARVSEMYRQLLLQRDPDGAVLISKAGIPPGGTHPDAVHDWWQRLDDEQRTTVVAAQPGLVGALDGVPAAARDRANRAVLDAEIAHQRELVQQYQAQQGRGRTSGVPLRAAENALAGLDAVRARLQADPQAHLLAISGAGDGRAVVALGNPDTAGQVLTYVPGMGSDLGTVPAQLGRMDDILARAPEGTAAIVWLGYDAPDLGPQVGFSSYAREAAEPLHRFQEGLRATHVGDPSLNVLLAHSYGSTTYGITAAEHGIAADKVYLIGSIGTNQESAHGFLGTSTSEVYATTHPWDVAHLPPAVDYYGTDPSDVLFDAQRLPGDYDGVLDSHTAYLHRPEILDNIAGLLTRRRP